MSILTPSVVNGSRYGEGNNMLPELVAKYKIIEHNCIDERFSYCNVNMLYKGKWIRAIGNVEKSFAIAWLKSRGGK